MGIFTSVENGTMAVRIEGELDVASLSDLKPALADIAGGQPPRVVVDLSALRLIDSSGVGAVVSLYKAVHAYGGSLAITGAHGQPLAILRLLRLDRLLSGSDHLAPWPR
jgi:anti-sigma B factor antagonist